MDESYTEKILITGALGQIGTELSLKLSQIYGKENVIISDLKDCGETVSENRFEKLDVTDFQLVKKLIEENKITTVYHLASLLSGTAESKPQIAWRLNIEPLLNFLNLAKDGFLKKIFWPSSIAVFGKGIPKNNVAQDVPLNPTSVYGITKVAGENWCEYFYNKFGVDVRSIRYPGLISWKAPAGGGTTDYAVEIFYKALQEGRYESFIAENTALPMLYMEDAISATVKLMTAPAENLSVRGSYNVGGMSFSPKMLVEEIRKEIPNFEISYAPDFREKIAESWPQSIDDSAAKADWGLSYEFDLEKMTKDMLKNLRIKLEI